MNRRWLVPLIDALFAAFMVGCVLLFIFMASGCEPDPIPPWDEDADVETTVKDPSAPPVLPTPAPDAHHCGGHFQECCNNNNDDPVDCYDPAFYCDTDTRCVPRPAS